MLSVSLLRFVRRFTDHCNVEPKKNEYWISTGSTSQQPNLSLSASKLFCSSVIFFKVVYDPKA
jgi:hypothetical protein